jgi:HD-like signal output (HDOD) protein
MSSGGGNRIEATLRQELVDTFHDANYRPPPLPFVAVQLADLSRRDDAGIKEVVRLLEQDQVLAGIVIRLVSSPVYAGRSPITSLQQAVVRLGLKTLRSVVFEAALRRGIFQLSGYRETAEQVGRHSTTAAYITKLVCEACGLDGENGFICGLLHDIGFSALLLSVMHVEGRGSPRLEDLWRSVDDMHERASHLVARLWGLPPEIVEVVGHHHHPELCEGTGAVKTAAAVCVADRLTERFGANILGPANAEGTLAVADAVSDRAFARARAALGLDDAKLDSVVEKAEKIVPDILWV